MRWGKIGQILVYMKGEIKFITQNENEEVHELLYVGVYLCVNSSGVIKIVIKFFVENEKYAFLGCRNIQHDFTERIYNIFYVSINKHLINFPTLFDALLRLCHIKD